MQKPETERTGPELETIVGDEIGSALRTFRASNFEARLRGWIRSESERPGRTRRPGRRRVLAWAGLALILVSGVSVGVWIRSRASRVGTAFATIKTVLAGSPLFHPTSADKPSAPVLSAASPSPFEDSFERALCPLFQRSLSAPLGDSASYTPKPVSVEELDRKIGELIQGHKLELFFSEYFKKEEDN